MASRQRWNPPPGIVHPMRSKNERDDNMRKFHEEKERIEQRTARGETVPEEPVACNTVKSNYDLRPR